MLSALIKCFKLAFLTAFLVYLIFPGKVLAQDAQSPSPSPAAVLAPSEPSTKEVNSTNYRAPQHAHFSIENALFGATCELVLFSGCITQRKIASTGETKVYVYSGPPTGGALGVITLPVVAMYATPPTSTTQYLASVFDGFGVIAPAYAQVSGSGDGIIKPILSLWQIMRNLAYLVFIIIFMVIGFMIMFRQKLNPQTVISVQAALPGLVIGLVLITFSYFLSALIVDLSFVGMQLVAQVFKTIPSIYDQPVALANNSNILSLWTSAAFNGNNFTDAVGGVYRTAVSASGPLPGAASALLIPAVIGAVVGNFLLPGVGVFVGAGVGAAAPLLIGILIPLILIIALFIQFIKLFIKLLNSYVMILVTTILAPFFILIGTVPGQSKTIGFWWKNLLGHSLTFPAVFAVFLFAGMILKTPPESWNASPPLFGGLSTELLRLAIAYGVMLGLPAVPDVIKKAVGAQDLGAIGTEGVKGFSGAFGLTANAATKGGGRLVAPYVEGAKRYREAKRARALGLDRYNEAQSIERMRQIAGEGSSVNRLINRAFFRFEPRPRDYRAPEGAREGLNRERNLFGWSNNDVRENNGLPREGE